jgi:hypothetical protein
VAQQRRNAGFTGPLLNPSTVKEHKSRLLPWGESPNWWQTGIIYQIYPRSFQNGVHGGVRSLRKAGLEDTPTHRSKHRLGSDVPR